MARTISALPVLIGAVGPPESDRRTAAPPLEECGYGHQVRAASPADIRVGSGRICVLTFARFTCGTVAAFGLIAITAGVAGAQPADPARPVDAKYFYGPEAQRQCDDALRYADPEGNPTDWCEPIDVNVPSFGYRLVTDGLSLGSNSAPRDGLQPQVLLGRMLGVVITGSTGGY
jgi:hypothetical protein